MHSRKFQTHNQQEQQYNNNNNNNSKMVANTNNLNPLACYNNTDFNMNSGMTHNDNGLRAASHVSMEHTIDAHEYQPTCKCADCQTLLKDFTSYNILDAYVTHHLAYESSLQANFGFVPAIGGPFGHIAMRTVMVDVLDEQTGAVIDKEAQQQPVPSQSYVFHMHLHHMNPVPADVKERSRARFYAPKDTIGMSSTGNNNNMSIPAPNSKRNNNNNNVTTHNNNYRNNGMSKAFAYQNNNNNFYGTQQQQNFAAAAPSHAVPTYYTRDDVEQATNATHYTGAARLGN